MKIVQHTLPLLGLLTALTACEKSIFGSVRGKGPVVNEIRSVDGFNKIKLDIDADVTYQQDSVYYLEVKAQDNILDVLTTKVSAGELCIDFSKWVRHHKAISLIIHSPSITSLCISSSGNIRSDFPIVSSTMEMTVSGSGDISLASLQTTDLETKISGSGDMDITGGTATNVHTTISGSGDVDFSGMTSNDCNAKISGSGSITVKVIHQLDATISGSGDILYYGTPIVNTHVTGSGSVVHL